MSVELELALAWLAFGGSHVLLSTRLFRPWAVKTLGLVGFKAAYSVVALGTFAWLITAYWTQRHAGANVMLPFEGARHVVELLMLIAFLFIGLGALQPSASSTVAEMGAPVPKEPRGIQRITRHPVNTGFAIFGLGHALVNTTVGDWIFWLGWPVFTILAALHQDARARAQEELRPFVEATSLLPFGAILAGRQRFAFRELSLVGGILGLAAFVALRLLHGRLIGGFEG